MSKEEEKETLKDAVMTEEEKQKLEEWLDEIFDALDAMEDDS